ncbi:hypothetical protein [Amycolatopsis sp. NPDC004378]
MDEHEIMLCERCWYPIGVDADYIVRHHHDELHPLLAPLSGFSHRDGDPQCVAVVQAQKDVAGNSCASPGRSDPRGGDERAGRRTDRREP